MLPLSFQWKRSGQSVELPLQEHNMSYLTKLFIFHFQSNVWPLYRHMGKCLVRRSCRRSECWGSKFSFCRNCMTVYVKWTFFNMQTYSFLPRHCSAVYFLCLALDPPNSLEKSRHKVRCPNLMMLLCVCCLRWYTVWNIAYFQCTIRFFLVGTHCAKIE